MKKFLTGSLTVMTIVWAMGLSAFVAVPASAAVGDLVKSASSSTVYVVKADGVTICQFPHANVYRSWGYPATFATVMTKDLSSYTVGSNIEFRDASLVKGDGPAVYLVYNNMKRPIISDVVFLGLGYDWDKITWLSDAFLADYTTGAVVDSSTMHPDGQIVKYAGGSAVYLIDNGMKRPFASGAAFEANRYSWGDIITIPDTETYPTGTGISGYEQALSLPTCIGTSAAPVGSGLSVALSPSTPASSSIIAGGNGNGGQALVSFITVNFTASSDGDVRVNTLKFKKNGISSDSSLDNLYLYEGNTKLTDGGSLSSGMVTFNSASGLFIVPAGTTKSVTVKGDVNELATAGQSIGFQLVAASDVTTNGGNVSGSFPANGNLMTIATVSDLAKVAVATSSVALEVEPDTQDQVVWQGTVYTSNQKVGLHYVKFTSLGSIQSNDLANFKLYDGGTLVATVAAMTSEREVIFDLMSNPINFNQGQSKSLKVMADIIKGSTRTFNFTIQEATDLVVKDQNYNVFVTPYVTGTYENWVVLRMNTDTEIKSGTLSVSKANTSPTGNVSQDGNNVKVATFELKATGEDMKVQNLNVMANFSSGTYNGGLDNARLFFNGIQVGATKDLLEDQAVNFTFGSSLIVPAGTTGVLDVYADIRSATGTQIGNTSQFRVSLEAGSSNVQKMASLDYMSAPGSQVQANILVVSAAALTANKYVAYGDQTFVSGTNMAKIGSAVLTAGSSEGVNVTSVTVSSTALMAASTTNMMLKDGAIQLGTTKVNPGATNIFSVNLSIPASGSKVVDIYADIKSNAHAGDMYFGLSAEGVGLVTNNSVSADEAVLQKISIGTGGLVATVDASRPNSDIIIAGTTKVLMNSVKFQAEYEDFQVQELRVAIDSALTPYVSSVTLEFPTQSGTATAVGIPANNAVNFTGLNMFVERDSSAILKIYIDVTPLASNVISGATGGVDFDVNAGYKHVGMGSGTTETDGTQVSGSDITGNEMVVRKSKPTVANASFGTSLMAGEQEISRVTITADAKGSIEIGQLHWDISTTTAIITANSAQLFDSNNMSQAIEAQSAPVFTSTSLKFEIKTPSVYGSIGAGQSKTFVLKAFVTRASGYNEVSTRLATPASTATDKLADLLSSAGLIWSDLSGSNHSTTTDSWATAQYVKTLPTPYQTLSVNLN